MDKELTDAFGIITSKVKSLKESLNSSSHEIGLLENQKQALESDIKGLKEVVVKLQSDRSDLQFFIDAKKKEDNIKTISMKQALQEVDRRASVLDKREKDLDFREVRIKDREVMYRK